MLEDCTRFMYNDNTRHRKVLDEANTKIDEGGLFGELEVLCLLDTQILCREHSSIVRLLDYIYENQVDMFSRIMTINIFTKLRDVNRIITLKYKLLDDMLIEYNLLNNPNLVYKTIPQNIDITYGNLVGSRWITDFIMKYRYVLKDNTYDANTINYFFGELHKMRCFDYRKGIPDYSALILMFGLDNVSHLLQDKNFLHSLSKMDKEGTMYPEIISVIGYEDFEYIESLLRLMFA